MGAYGLFLKKITDLSFLYLGIVFSFLLFILQWFVGVTSMPILDVYGFILAVPEYIQADDNHSHLTNYWITFYPSLDRSPGHGRSFLSVLAIMATVYVGYFLYQLLKGVLLISQSKVLIITSKALSMYFLISFSCFILWMLVGAGLSFYLFTSVADYTLLAWSGLLFFGVFFSIMIFRNELL